ncbi:hypothetical protein CHUAL_006321 [Chamberlinius hualienensis]
MDVNAKESIEDVVVLDGVTKIYSSFPYRHKQTVLNHVSLTIPTGTIFGLLGPSGCGKTTLLRCVIGQVKPDSGTVSAFSFKPGTKRSGIPGTRVGYMPQDVALTSELSITETLRFFGRIAKMSSKQVKCRVEFLLKLLQMDSYQNKVISTLSGGQKRRISFAVALLHEPELLILDEPTVGVDPLLRQKIWKHLYSLASEQSVSIVVTTHYIEEARMAHNVGLMLNGRLLIQSPPEELIIKYQCSTLEEAFFQLCLTDEQQEIDGNRSETENSLLALQVDDCSSSSSEKKNQNDFDTPATMTKSNSRAASANRQFLSLDRLLALTIKNFYFSVRHPATILMQVFIVPLTFSVFALSIGKAPFGIEVGIVNHDKSELSHLYIDSLNKHLVRPVHFDSYDEAIKATEDGLLAAALYLNPNFTDSIIEKYSHTVLADDQIIADSKINLVLDLTDKQVAISISQEILKAFQTFSKFILNRVGINPALADLPLNYHTNVDSVLDFEFDQFLLPGFLISIVFFTNLGTTTINMINDKQLGSFDRLRVLGVNECELIISQMISSTIVLFIMVPMAFLVVFIILGFTCVGSPILAMCLNILQGICGICFGILVAILADQLTTAIVLVLSLFFVGLMVQGIIWALDSLPIFFRYISYCLPSTYSVKAMRLVVNHACGLSCQPVIFSIVTSSVWIAVIILVSWAVFRYRLS